MEIVIGIALYFGFAVFVGRFLSLSHAPEMILPAAPHRNSGLPLYEPQETTNLPAADRPAPAERMNTREREEELILR